MHGLKFDNVMLYISISTINMFPMPVMYSLSMVRVHVLRTGKCLFLLRHSSVLVLGLAVNVADLLQWGI